MKPQRVYFSKVGDPSKFGIEGGFNVGSRRLASFIACLFNWIRGFGWTDGKPTLKIDWPRMSDCPFCGSDQVIVGYVSDNLIEAGHCIDCCAFGPTSIDKRQAIELWNKRA